MAADLLMVKAVTDNLEVSHNETEAKDLNIINVNFRIINFREVHFNRTVLNMAPATNPIFREIKQIATEVEAIAGVLINLEDAVMVGPIIRVAMESINISIKHDPQTEQYGPPCSLCSSFNHSPKHCYKGEHDINNIMEKMSINKLYIQQILIPLMVRNNIHVLPGKTGIVLLTLQPNKTSFIPRHTITGKGVTYIKPLDHLD